MKKGMIAPKMTKNARPAEKSGVGPVRKVSMDEIDRFRVFNLLKSTYRLNSVPGRKESSAEHTWSAIMLADFFLTQMGERMDRLKVYELLMYHDVVEIEAGDTPLHPGIKSAGKAGREKAAMQVLKKRIPVVMRDKYVSLFEEFEGGITSEAKFAKAIDQLDAEIHELDHRADWKGWTREFLIEKKERYFKEFPLLLQAFHTLLDYMVENGYFSQ